MLCEDFEYTVMTYKACNAPVCFGYFDSVCMHMCNRVLSV